MFLGNNPLNGQNFVLYGSNYVPIYKKQIYGIELCPTGSSDNIGVIIGAVIAATVVCVASAIIITLLCIRHNRLAKKKYKTRQDSHNEYTEQPSAVRLFIV